MIKQDYTVEKDDYLNAGKVSSQIKNTLKQLEMPVNLLRRIAVACYEAEINMIIHSDGGIITMEINDDKLYLRFNDNGPGIDDLEKAFTPGYSTADQKAREMGFGAGMGLVNIRRVSDELKIKSSKAGTKLELWWNL